MTETLPFGLSQIGQIAINVQDLKRAEEFYRDKLGMKFLMAFPGLSFFDCGGVRLMLSRAEKPEFDHPSSVIYYKVENLDQACGALRERGVIIQDEPHLIAKLPDHDLWMAFLRDSENNLLGLMCNMPKGAS